MKNSRVRLKICGMTQAKDIDLAVQLGADAIGCIFYEKSKRALRLTQAKTLLRSLPPFVDAVAVLVNPEVDFVKALLSELPLQYLQFHGNETAAFCEQFHFPYIKAIQAYDAAAINEGIKTFSSASALLFDTPSEKKYGGTGKSFDWQIIPKNIARPYILAGGLSEDNINSALQHTNPYAVDLCSGVEASAGIKDADKMKRFVQALRTSYES